MAKKKEQAAVVPDQAAATPETTEEPWETAAPEIVDKPQETETPKARDISEIMNDKAEIMEENKGMEETPAISETEGNGQPEPEEKILFYVKTVNDKTAVRSAPEYPMAGTNVIDVITDRGPYGIADVENGFGRIAGGTGWIMLDSSVVMRQG